MRLCMFHPAGHPMERGWVGRIEGDEVIHLAAQTLQSFFSGGGSAREHAVYPLAEVTLLAPVLHPPSVRVFDDQDSFAFANPAAICADAAEMIAHELLPRLAAVIGADGAIGGFTAFADWRRTGRTPPKDRDFALGVGPAVVTPDELDPAGLEVVVRVDAEERLCVELDGFDWFDARALAADGTTLLPGDLLAGPAPAKVSELGAGVAVELVIDGIGVLSARIEGSDHSRSRQCDRARSGSGSGSRPTVSRRGRR